MIVGANWTRREWVRACLKPKLLFLDSATGKLHFICDRGEASRLASKPSTRPSVVSSRRSVHGGLSVKSTTLRPASRTSQSRLRVTYAVVQTGSRIAGSDCGMNLRTRSLSACPIAGRAKVAAEAVRKVRLEAKGQACD